MPHALASPIAATFPALIASTLTDSNYLLTKRIITKVNDCGAIFLIRTDPNRQASSYSPYFDAISRCLNQFYPIGASPWQSFTMAPTTMQLAIHYVPVHVLSDKDKDLLVYLKESIYDSKEGTISGARYPNQDGYSRLSQETTSVVVSVDPNDVRTLLPAPFIVSKSSRSKKQLTPAITPWVPIATTLAKPPNTAPKNSPRVPTVLFIILVLPTVVRTPPAPKEVTPNQCQSAALPHPPIAPTGSMTTISSSENTGLDQTGLLNSRPPTYRKGHIWILPDSSEDRCNR